MPAREATFSKVDINGNEGVAVVPNDGSTPMLLWSNGEQVFAMTGQLPMDELLEIASWLVTSGAALYEMRCRRKNLEEWFVEIMGQDQRSG